MAQDNCENVPLGVHIQKLVTRSHKCNLNLDMRCHIGDSVPDSTVKRANALSVIPQQSTSQTILASCGRCRQRYGTCGQRATRQEVGSGKQNLIQCTLTCASSGSSNLRFWRKSEEIYHRLRCLRQSKKPLIQVCRYPNSSLRSRC